MIRSILRSIGVWPYLKYIKKRYFPSATQRDEDRLVAPRSDFYKQFIKEGDLCFDVGANIGNRTEVFLKIGAKVVAVEPQSDCAKLLKLRFGRRIGLVTMALGSRKGREIMYMSETSEISSLSKDWIDSVSTSRFKDQEWNRMEEILLTTLDDLIAQYGLPHFCKIDVEGYEEEVLKGLSKPMRFISFEYTIPERLENVSNCFYQLSRIGQFDCNYTVGENMKLELPVWVSKDDILNRLREMSVKELFGDIYIRFREPIS